MKKSLTAIAILLVTSSVFAETNYPENPVLRPLTLTDGTISLTGGLVTGEQDDDNRGEAFIGLAYGITDNLMIGDGGIKYRVLARPDNKTGLELAVGFGLRGYQEYLNEDYSIGYGLDLSGKYVVSDSFSVNFGLDVVKWAEEHRKDKSEYRYSIGAQQRLAEDWTASASYTYRDLKDFVQSDANEARAGINYTYSKDMDIGLFAAYSDFDAKKNGYKLDNSFDRSVSAYVTYRF